MSQLIRTFRVGMDPDALANLIDERAVEIFGVEPDDSHPRDRSWSSDDVRQGRVQFVPDEPGNTMVRISVTTVTDTDPEEVLDEVAERLGDVLPEGGGLERPAMIVEPAPGEPPEAETSEDQPL